MDVDLAAAFTRELHGFVATVGTRRALPTCCYVGRPGEPGHDDRVALADPGSADTALRTDLVERALDGLLEPETACAWLTRGGELGATDTEIAWSCAAQTAFARHGLRLPAFVVLTRRAWVDLVSGEGRAWRRVRTRTPGAH